MRKPLWTYLACCIAVFMVAMDNLIVTNALPVIRQALHTGLEGLEWTVNAYTLTFAVLPLLLLARESRSGAGRLDPAGVILATTGLFGVVFGLVRGNGHGWTSAQVLSSLAGGGLLIVAFLIWESRTASPMMPLSLFRSRGFSASSATTLLTNMGMFGVIFLVSQFLQSVKGYTPLGAGVHGLPWTAAPAVTAPVAGLLSDRLGGRRIVAIGVALQAIGIGWLAAEVTPAIPYADLVPPFLIAGTGLGFFFAPITRLTLSYAPGQLEGIASGTSYALRQVGTVLGVAVLGSVFSAVGGLGGPGPFTTGLTAALTVSAAVLGASALVVLLAPETRTAPQAAASGGTAGAGGGPAVPYQRRSVTDQRPDQPADPRGLSWQMPS